MITLVVTLLLLEAGASGEEERIDSSQRSNAPPVTSANPRTLGSQGRIEFFEKRIRPLFAEHCHGCHGAEKQKSGLRLDLRESVLRGGDRGLVVAPGEPDRSLLLRAVRYLDPKLAMPPGGKLSDREIADLERWVALGAPWPADRGAKAATTAGRDSPAEDGTPVADDLWSLRPLDSAVIPSTAEKPFDSVASGVDAFIRAKLDGEGLARATLASRRVWLRRVSFDLVGLPPTLDEIAAFDRDSSPRAYERVVDRLLASPRFGERWARHWLDVVRYTETAGHVQDRVRPNAWRYRDYVIDALNEDLPFARFVGEHIAGDLLSPRAGLRGESNIAPVATGFLWFHEMHFRPIDPVGQRADQVDAQIDVLGKAFLGLTVACARCHDHKFDPISQRDYYALAGFFHSTEERNRALVAETVDREGGVPDERAARIAKLGREIDALQKKARGRVRARQANKTKVEVPVTEINFDVGLQNQLGELRAELASLDPRSALWAPAATDVEGRDVRFHRRGDHSNLGEIVPRRFLSAFDRSIGSVGAKSPRSDDTTLRTDSGDAIGARETDLRGSGRRYLANRLASPANPLTARVYVNRVWQHLFGAGIVRTPNNFGHLGDRPTHPELLDWLALRFHASGGSTKSLVRALVLTRTYRSSSLESERALEIDPENRLLQHMPVRRLEAEVLRDGMLAIAGSLSHSLGGESVAPYLSPNVTANKPVHIPRSGPLDGSGRRSVYIRVRRNFVNPFLGTFDFPDQGASVARRDVSLGPAQALAMMNSPFVHEMARRWGIRNARASESVSSESDDARLGQMFRAALTRDPSPVELDILGSFLSDRRHVHGTGAEASAWADVAHVLFNSTEFLILR